MLIVRKVQRGSNEEALKAAKMDKETFLKLKEKYEPVQTK